MKTKSYKRKKPRTGRGSWLQNLGSFLTGIAALLEVAFKVVIYLKISNNRVWKVALPYL